MSLRLREGRVGFTLPEGFPGGRDIEELLAIPAAARLELRRDAITVLGGDDWVYGEDEDWTGPLPCADGDPTVTNTDRMKVRSGKHTDQAQLLVDLAYGDFEPGFTAEADGSSEVELDARFDGTTAIRLTRDADTVTTASTEDEIGVSINPTEAIPDTEARLTRTSPLIIDGAGGADAIDGSRLSLPRGSLGSSYVAGGQGADRLTGGPGSDLLSGDSGADMVRAGAGDDAVVVSGRAADRIDCGPGVDFAIAVERTRGDHRFSHCEKVESFKWVLGREQVSRSLRRAVQRLRQLRRG